MKEIVKKNRFVTCHIVILIEEVKVDINYPDLFGQTALYYLLEGNIIKIMSMTATPIYIDEVISLNAGISFTINCTTIS